MKSFDLHFDTKGKTKIDNIQGVSGSECKNLTDNYVGQLHSGKAPIDSILIDVQINDGISDQIF